MSSSSNFSLTLGRFSSVVVGVAFVLSLISLAIHDIPLKTFQVFYDRFVVVVVVVVVVVAAVAAFN